MPDPTREQVDAAAAAIAAALNAAAEIGCMVYSDEGHLVVDNRAVSREHYSMGIFEDHDGVWKVIR